MASMHWRDADHLPFPDDARGSRRQRLRRGGRILNGGLILRLGRVLSLGLILGLGLPGRGVAQEMVSEPLPSQPQTPTPLLFAVGGAAGGALGMVTGAVVGGGLQGCGDVMHFEDSCQEEGIYLGALLGSTLGSILGVKLVGRVSNAPASTGGTILGAAVGVVGGYLVGLGVTAVTDEHEVPFGFGFSIGQGAVTGIVAGLFHSNPAHGRPGRSG